MTQSYVPPSEHFKINTELRWNPEGTGGLAETSIVCGTCGSGYQLSEGFFAEEPLLTQRSK